MEKKRKSRSSDKKGLATSLSQWEGGEPWHALEARGGRALPNTPVKTQTQESDYTWDGDPSRSRGSNLRVLYVLYLERFPSRVATIRNTSITTHHHDHHFSESGERVSSTERVSECVRVIIRDCKYRWSSFLVLSFPSLSSLPLRAIEPTSALKLARGK